MTHEHEIARLEALRRRADERARLHETQANSQRGIALWYHRRIAALRLEVLDDLNRGVLR